MNAQGWKLSVTGESCPPWCAGEHADQDPERDSILHESAPITVELPPLLNGEQLRLEFTTLCSEDYRTHDQGRTPAQVEFGVETEHEEALHDYVPVPSVQALDKLIADLRGAAGALAQWRDWLPSAA